MRKAALLGLLGLLTGDVARPEIFYSPGMIRNLIAIYNNQPKEVSVCIEGNRYGSIYVPNKIEIPHTILSTDRLDSLDFSNCMGKGLLGIAHQHNSGSCPPSDIDIESFMKYKNLSLEIVICGVNKERGLLDISTTFKKEGEVTNVVDHFGL